MTLGRYMNGFGVLVLALLLLPGLVVVAISFGQSPTYTFPPGGLSLRWFASLFRNQALMDAFFRVSLPLGMGVALLATLIGTFAALGISRGRFYGQQLMEAAFMLPLLYPHVLLGVALFLMYVRIGMTPSIWGIGLAHVLITCPYVIRTVMSGLSGIDPRLEEAAQNLGASPAKAFFLVTFPLLRSSIVSGAIFAFIVSFGDINVSMFLAAADTSTLPVQILAQMQWASDPTIAAASTLQALIISALLLISLRLSGTKKLM